MTAIFLPYGTPLPGIARADLSIRGTWQRTTRDGKETARIACPYCGFAASLAETHEIDSTGRVTPSVVCPTDDCAFHDYVFLHGWPEGLTGEVMPRTFAARPKEQQ